MKGSDKRILVLSGGGGRGAYHVGALEYLEKAGWQPDIVVGSSVGAVNAAALGLWRQRPRAQVPLDGPHHRRRAADAR